MRIRKKIFKTNKFLKKLGVEEEQKENQNLKLINK